MIMPEIHDQHCPLCHKPAKYEDAERGNRKHFLCDNCTEFQISDGAERRLAHSISQWSAQLSERARQAPEDHVLVITLSSAPKQKDVANPTLDHEYVPRSKVPR